MRTLGSILLLTAASPAWACPVCMAPGGPNSDAFLGSTIFLSLLPLAMMFGGGVWIFRRATAA